MASFSIEWSSLNGMSSSDRSPGVFVCPIVIDVIKAQTRRLRKKGKHNAKIYNALVCRRHSVVSYKVGSQSGSQQRSLLKCAHTNEQRDQKVIDPRLSVSDHDT